MKEALPPLCWALPFGDVPGFANTSEDNPQNSSHIKGCGGGGSGDKESLMVSYSSVIWCLSSSVAHTYVLKCERGLVRNGERRVLGGHSNGFGRVLALRGRRPE